MGVALVGGEFQWEVFCMIVELCVEKSILLGELGREEEKGGGMGGNGLKLHVNALGACCQNGSSF